MGAPTSDCDARSNTRVFNEMIHTRGSYAHISPSLFTYIKRFMDRVQLKYMMCLRVFVCLQAVFYGWDSLSLSAVWLSAYGIGKTSLAVGICLFICIFFLFSFIRFLVDEVC